jgi:hypothetical protein
VTLGILTFPQNSYTERIKGITALIMETVKRTNIDLKSTIDRVVLKGDIFNYPILIISGDNAFTISEQDAKLLRDYLQMGGTLLIDNSGGVKGNSFDLSLRREFKKVFPENNFEPVPLNHVIFRTFYLLKNVSGRVINQPFLEGLKVSDRYAVIYSANDLFGALARDEQGRWLYDVYPGGERQREYAVRLGINILMYAITLDYKDDQVHKPFILRREGY